MFPGGFIVLFISAPKVPNWVVAVVSACNVFDLIALIPQTVSGMTRWLDYLKI